MVSRVDTEEGIVHEHGLHEEPAHAHHFESIERQALTARFGMWVFLASELLLFGGLFTIYGFYRVRWPEAFNVGVQENNAVLGTTNTVVLITSSLLVALSVQAVRAHRLKAAAGLLVATIGLGLAFLAIKLYEYFEHFHHGIYPGGVGEHFAQEFKPGEPVFFTLYYVMTGLHAVHVIVGLGVIAWLAWRAIRGRLLEHVVEVGALYWHLVDVIWIFLWPLFYLMVVEG